MDKKLIAELNKKSKPPINQNIKYHSFICCEIFQIENYDKLINGLDILFSEYYKNRHITESKDYKNFLKEAISRLKNYSVLHVGTILPIKAKGRILPQGPFFDLPVDIDFVSVQLLNLFPSLTFLIFNVALSPEFSKKIILDLRKDYPEEKREAIDKKNKKYHIHYSPKDLKEETIRNRIFELKNNFEKFISKHLKGKFLSKERDTKIGELALPYINVIYLDKIPIKDLPKLKRWIRKHSSFLECINIWSNSRFLFSKGQFLLSEPYRSSPNFFNFSLVSSKDLLNDHNLGSEDEELWLLTQSMRGIEFFSLLKYCYSQFEILKIYRESVKELSYMGVDDKSIKELIDKKKRTDWTCFKLERFIMEFRRYVDGKFWNVDLIDFDNLEKNDKKLYLPMIEHIKTLIESVFNETNFLSKKIDNHYSFTNTLINNRISKYVAYLTIILSCLTGGMFLLMIIQAIFQ